MPQDGQRILKLGKGIQLVKGLLEIATVLIKPGEKEVDVALFLEVTKALGYRQGPNQQNDPCVAIFYHRRAGKGV